MATCELLGLPIPGLLKAELFHFTKAAKLPPPVYKAATMAPFNETAFYSTVTVAGTTYSGFLAPSKKDAEFWAAQVALRKLNIGILLYHKVLAFQSMVFKYLLLQTLMMLVTIALYSQN